MEEVTLPEGLLYIQPHAFLKCNNLKKLVCPNVRLFLECACYLCKNLEELHVSNKLEIIQGQSFYGCGKL